MTKILVIEDNPTIREEVLTWLMLEEYEAAGAANGREGISSSHSSNFLICFGLFIVSPINCN